MISGDLDKGVTIFLMAYLSIYPVLVFLYTYFKAHKGISEKYESLYDTVQTGKGRPPLMNVFIFLLRRILVGFSLMLMPEYPVFQMILLIISSLGILAYFIYVKPFIKNDDEFFEIFNEASLLISFYIIFAILITSSNL